MTTLVLGANTTLSRSNCQVKLHSQLNFGQQIGALWLPLGEQRQVVTSPAYLHETKDWATLSADTTWQLDLDKVFQQYQAKFLQLIIYSYYHVNMNLPAVEVNHISVTINQGEIHYQFSTPERHVKASIILEIYQRNGQYKCRALAESSTQSLASLGERLQISLDARPPTNQLPQPQRPQTGDTWTGTAFAIDNYHLLTCRHVVEGANLIGLHQQGYTNLQAQVVITDEGSDSALLKVNQPLPSFLPLRETGYDLLGENITTLGFPLTGFSSQLQVTQGNIAGLRGSGNDIRYLQFTAPIQPGSSGSPLLLPTGEVVGMVTSSLVHEHAQNMNYAVKYQLLSALVTSAGLNLTDLTTNINHTPLSTPQLTKQSKNALWLVGCQA